MKTIYNHLIFTLLMCAVCMPTFSQTTLIDYGSNWSYFDNQSEPAVQGAFDWNDNSYDASAWSTGNAHLGYGDGDEATVINSNTLTAYVRHSFNVADPSVYDLVNLNLTFDDGAVVYLNGVEVWRINMPGGTISYGTFSSSVGTENGTAINNIANVLLTGTNVLAVEIHQASASSSDISFDFKLSANIVGQTNITRGPYLQKGTSSSMVLRWRTLTPTESVVDYGTSLGALNQNSSDLTLKTEHEVEITGLNSNTVYYYQISNASSVLMSEANDVFFKTHPIIGSSQPFTFWALGDAGTANNNQRAVRDAYYNYIGSNVTDGILFLGDNAYNDGTDNEYQLAVFENMYEDKLKNSVAWSCLGNHDGHSADSNTQTGPYYDIFTFPTAGESGGMASGTEAYYSFDYGNVHFIVLDSYETDRSVGSAMYNWAQSDIQNTTQEWIIAFWHHPPYTKGSHDSDTEGQLIDMRQNFLPMLENNGVDLVLSGHSHSYERSYFLNGHYGTSGTFNSGTHTVGANGDGDGKIDGTGVYNKGASDTEGAVYITAGSSGKVTGTLTNHNAMAVSLYELGSCILEVDGSTLNVKFIRETGAIDDYFTIEKGCSTVGQSCDDGDACTTNDVFDANCGCAGTALPDSDGDGVCDDLDQCPGFDDNIDTNNNNIPDGCESICTPFTGNFNDNPLTHSGSGSNSTTLVLPTDSQDVTFTISGINQKLNGKANRRYIERVVVTYLDEFGNTQAYGTYSGASQSTANIDIQGKVQSITVNLSDEYDGSTASTMDITFTQVSYCINSTPPCTTPDADGDGVCDAEDICPGFDDNLIGTSCDDGEDCTSNDMYTVDCDCVGTPEPDTDGDGICDAIDSCPNLDNSLIGTSCDDGDACTTNDVYTVDCNCEGTPVTDNDGDGYCGIEDPDDSDPCVPDVSAPGCSQCGDIINDSFESGFGNWNDGGGDCARTTTNANTGIYSVRLRDNSGNSSSMYTNNLDLSSYTEVTFNFSYYPVSMETGEDFFLEVSTNGGNSYSIFKSWISGTDFNNNTRYNESVSITGISFTSTTVFRLRCDASKKNDQVYIDDVVITDCPSGLAKTSRVTSLSEKNDIKIYPNPVSQVLFIKYNYSANIVLYNMIGQKVRNKDMNGQNNQIQEIDLNGLADGIYLLRIADPNGNIIKTKRIVIKN